MKWIVSISWSRFKVSVYNCVHDFTIFNFVLKDVSILTSYTPLDTQILNRDHKIDIIHFI
jgi:hypothetical protein